MPYRLTYEEPIETQVRALIGKELEYAANQLRKKGPDVSDAVHEARKSLKKARALLRLVQPYLGPLYRQENDSLRQIARELSHIRDAGAILDSLKDLRKRYSDRLSGPEIDPAERAFLERKKQLEGGGGSDQTLPKLAEQIEEAADRAKNLNVAADGFAAISTGLEIDSGAAERQCSAPRRIRCRRTITNGASGSRTIGIMHGYLKTPGQR